MNRSKIEYCDHTLNIITGCRYKCEYCYARQMSRRFSGNVKMNIKQRDKYRMEKGVYVLDEPFLDETGQQVLYPFGFEPTLHRYRYGVLDKLKMGQNILVGAMADMFGEWVPDSWIYDVFDICRQHPKNNYLFLTVNPERYMDLDLPEETNMYYGTTITKADDVYRAGFLPEGKKKFICIEPLLEDSGKWIKPALAGKSDWIIIGAETWKRKGMVVPEFEWIKSIVLEADTYLYHYINEKLFEKTVRRGKEKLTRLVSHVMIYMDDIVVFGGNKKHIHKAMEMIVAFTRDFLGLVVKPTWQKFLVSYKTNQGKTKGRNLDFMGFVFCGMEAFYRIYDGTKKRLKRVKVIVRDSIFLRGRRKFSKLIKKIKNRRTVSKHYAMSLLAYHGWIKNTDSFQFQSSVMWKEIIGIARNIVSRSEKGKPYTCDKYYQKWRTLYA